MFASRRNQESVSSPITSLPVELLSEIFSLCTLGAGEPSPREDGDYSPLIITTETVRVPLILSSVNRRWRDVVLSQSSLWSNLCITAELIGDPHLNTKQLATFLQRSRQAPLNIYIDARDPEWNFAEAGVGIDFGDAPAFPTLFSSDHMNTVVSLLTPHLSRWKALTILTDAWAPMHAALATINPSITSFGAPQLQSMTLMRCNDFVSFSPQFQPRDLKQPSFLTRADGTPDSSASLLPRLKHLSLRGVHVDWDTLGDALAASASSSQISSGGLSFLELASHCPDVRPSLAQFHKLLAATPSLRTFVVTGSGPEIPDELDEVPQTPEHDSDPVHLAHLQSVTIGYRTSLEGRSILKSFDAPNVKSLVLEDATYPGDPEEVNGSSLLNYLGSKEFGLGRSSADQRAIRTTAGPVQGEHQGQTTQNKQPSSVKRRKHSSYSGEPLSSRAAFPLVENVALKSVRSPPSPLQTFFGALPHLKHLELVGMSMHAVNALIPSSTHTSSASDTVSSRCPCPQLRSLCIRDSEKLHVQDLDFIIGDLATERESRGACGLRKVDIHLDAAKAACVAAAASPGTEVTIFSDSEDDDEDEDDEDMDMDPFKPGGAFNDPAFDEYYSAQIAAR